MPRVILFLGLLGSIHLIKAQEAAPAVPISINNKPVLRHTTGIQGIALKAGIAAIGKYLAMDWNYFFAPAWQIKLGIGAAWAMESQHNDYNLFTQPAGGYTLLSNQRNLFLNILGAGVLSYAWQQRVNQQQQPSYLNIGLLVEAELEVFILRHWALVLAVGPQFFVFNTRVGRLDYALSLGVRRSC